MKQERAEQILSALENELYYIKMTFPYWDGEVECNFEDQNSKKPFTDGNNFVNIIVDVKNRKVMDWDMRYGNWSVHAKPVDEGEYDFLNKDFKLICRQKGYVPNEFIPPQDGYGDYIAINVDTEGCLTNWFSASDFRNFVTDNTMIVLPEDLESITVNAVDKVKRLSYETLLPLSKNIWSAAQSRFKSKYDNLERTMFMEDNRAERNYFDSLSQNNLDYSFSRSYNLKATELVRKLGISFHFRHYQSAVNDKFWTFNEDFVIEFRPDSYYISLLNKELDYNELITNEDMEKIQNALAKAIIDKYQDGIVQNNPYRWRL